MNMGNMDLVYMIDTKVLYEKTKIVNLEEEEKTVL